MFLKRGVVVVVEEVQGEVGSSEAAALHAVAREGSMGLLVPRVVADAGNGPALELRQLLCADGEYRGVPGADASRPFGTLRVVQIGGDPVRAPHVVAHEPAPSVSAPSAYAAAVAAVLEARLPIRDRRVPHAADGPLAEGQGQLAFVIVSSDDEELAAERLRKADAVVAAVRAADPHALVAVVASGMAVSAADAVVPVPWVTQSCEIDAGGPLLADELCDWRAMPVALLALGRSRKDRCDRFCPEAASRSGAAGRIRTDQWLPELAYLLGCTPKYGA